MMFDANPFSLLSDSVSPTIIKAFVVLMIVFVAGGTLLDLALKRSATFFFQNARHHQGDRKVSPAQRASLAVKTIFVDWLAAGEFCSAPRRVAHLLTMYGFLAYAISTVVMVFVYPAPDAATPMVWPLLWHIGALLVCFGVYWFWFFIRVDVAAEGHSRWRVVQADLFVLSLLANCTLALVWSTMQSSGRVWTNVALALYLVSAIALFGSVPWSKFSHMFYKPAAAFQKRVEDANGSRANLPLPADKPAALGSARTQPTHY